MKIITQCRSCNSSSIEPFLNLGEQPFANSLLESPKDSDPFYPLSLSFCLDCSLVQLNHTADPGELFSQYVWVTGTSSTAKKYAKIFSERVLQERPLQNEEYILEAASNDGTVLKAFSDKGVSVLGVDPAQNIVAMANKAGIPTECHFFGENVAKEIVSRKGKAAVVIARNVVPHVANLRDFIAGLATALKEDGMMVLEIHHANTILNELHYDSIYHEHLCYFSFKAASALLTERDFQIFRVDTSPISGGSMVLYASRKLKKQPGPDVAEILYKEEQSQVNTWEAWKNFAKRTQEHKNQLLELLDDKTNGHIVGWGASARSSTLLNFCQIGTDRVTAIIDNNPMKQGLFTAGTHIPIQSAEKIMANKPDTVFVLAWNFFREIAKELYDKYQFRGNLIVPFPKNPTKINIKDVPLLGEPRWEVSHD